MTIIPITKAREQLGDLAGKASWENYFVLTKGGEPEVALVDYKYLLDLENKVKRIYQKTYIDPKLLTYTRKFSQKEIDEWQKEDQL